MLFRNGFRSLAAVVLSLVPLLAAAEKAESSVKPGEYLPFKDNDIIMIVGDSIGGPHDIIPMLQKACPEKNLRFFNCSLGTTTIKDVFQRLDRDLIRSDLGSEADVDWYFIMFGANDCGVQELLDGGYEAYYRQVISALKRRTRAKVIPVCTVPFSGAAKKWNEKTGVFADKLKALGKEYGLQVVDLFHPCLDFIQQHDDAAFAKDGIHATPEAHVFMAETVLKELSFYDLHEQLALDLKNNHGTGTDGCAVERISANGAGYTVVLRNRFDFAHTVALTPEGGPAFDAYLDTGEKLALKDGRIVVPLPAPIRFWAPDLKQVQTLAEADKLTDISKRAGKILEALNVAATCTLQLVPPGGPAPKATPRREPFPIEAESIAVWKAVAALNPEGKSELQKAAANLVQQFCDLRINFPKEVASAKIQGGCRATPSLARAGEAAAKPHEEFEVVFYNFNCSAVRGTLSIALPARGWQAAPAGQTAFEGLQPGQRFAATFQLTGEETCTHQGALTAKIEYEVQGVKLQKEATFKLFAPWLGIGPFCDKKENEKDSLSVQLATVYPPEKGLDPKAVYDRYDGKKLTWMPVRSIFGYPGIDVAGQFHWGHWNKFLLGSDIEVFTPWQPPTPVYFAQWVYSPEERDVALFPIFCSKVAKIWVNQKAVLELDGGDKPGARGMNWTQVRTWTGTPQTVPARLAKGWNEVLFKVTGFTPWGDPSAFGCQILDKELHPLPDLLGSSAPPPH